jgi:hypothetical protein
MASFVCGRHTDKQVFTTNNIIKYKQKLFPGHDLVRDSSAVQQHFFLLEQWDIRELYIRKTADLPLQLLVGTFPHFVAIGFYFLSETLI